NSYVPTLQEDGFTLYESNAIVRYLAGRDEAARLWPKDLRARADSDRWMEWQSNTFSPAMRDAFWQLIRTPATNTSRRSDSRSPTSWWAARPTGGSTCPCRARSSRTSSAGTRSSSRGLP